MPRMNIDRPVDVVAETRDIDQLKFDINNVRIAHIPPAKRPKAQDEIAEWLWRNMGDNIRRLYASIVNSQGLHEELYIRVDSTVVEGNDAPPVSGARSRRASDGKLNGIKPDVFRRVEVKLFPDGTPERTLKIFVTRLHVVGKDQWKAINQAQLVTELVDESGQDQTAAESMVRKFVKAPVLAYKPKKGRRDGPGDRAHPRARDALRRGVRVGGGRGRGGVGRAAACGWRAVGLTGCTR